MSGLPQPPALPPPLRPLPHRHDGEEILDRAPELAPVDRRRTLDAMQKVNRFLGGTRSLLTELRRLAPLRAGRRLELLDLGVGRGDLPRELATRLRRENIEVDWTGLDRDAEVLRLARTGADPPGPGGAGPPRGLVRGDVRRLPFRDDAFDVAISSLTLHHLDDPGARACLAEAARVSRLAVLASDLERSPVHYLGARLLAATWWRRDPITRYDGPLSVLRSFTRDELVRLASPLAFRAIEVRRRFPFRIVLDGRPE